MSVEENTIKRDEVKEAPRPVYDMLLELVDSLPVDHFTLEWLLGRLDRRSFGIVLLVLSLAALAPGISMLAGPLLAVPAFEMIPRAECKLLRSAHRGGDFDEIKDVKVTKNMSDLAKHIVSHLRPLRAR